ncbi:riboflavin synthase [Lentisphaera profundi]|uniref:Riboflavin synthase n=1 Tax=Lentisphaera profundi TaxID=1658616 RepID=A0ABY7VY62_9BACT|nr:riboflavin synthase [Lentisphaera profundi]WDE97812.1 riboflavin synthase [Lentisphaera profundi]
MFGGIIKHSGSVHSISGNNSNGIVLELETSIVSQVQIGDSVGVNGVCLTVTEIISDSILKFDVWPESLQRTTLADLKIAQEVHVDLPLKASDFIGGHPVLGHVDFVGSIVSMSQVDNASQLKIWIALPAEYSSLIPARGSIAVDGVSLTITGRNENSFAISLIPETLRLTHLGELKAGDALNIEVDFSSRALQDKSGMINLANEAETISDKIDTIAAAIDTYTKGGLLLIQNKESFALCSSAEKITDRNLSFALSLSRTPCTVAVTEGLAEKLFIPAPVINTKAEERRFLLPVNHRANELHDYTTAAMKKSISLFCSDELTIDDWMTPGNINPLQIYGANSSSRPGLPEAAVALCFKSKLPHAAICQNLIDADGKEMNSEQAHVISTRYQIPIYQVSELISENSELFEDDYFGDL